MLDPERIKVKNKRAYFEYEILDKYEAGLKLLGTEIKAIRHGKAAVSEAYCFFHKGELFVKNMHIGEYTKGNINNHEPTRTRKLLLTKKELRRLEDKKKEKGLTIVPLRLFINNRGYAKLQVGLAKGKKTHDKRQTIKARESKRQVDRILKQYK